MLEMTIPSSLDKTIAPPGCHVCLIFSQFTPYHLRGGKTWDQKTKQAYAKQVKNHTKNKEIVLQIFLKVFHNIDEYAPGFSSSVIGYEVLSPPDLEKTFGLTGGVSNTINNFTLNYANSLDSIAEYFPRCSLAGPTVYNACGRRIWPMRPFNPRQESTALRKRGPPWRRRHGLSWKNGRPPSDQNAQKMRFLKYKGFVFKNVDFI